MVDLAESAECVLDAAGNGTARVGPGRAGTRWLVTTVAVLGVGNPSPIPRVYLYRGDPSPGGHVTSSYNGNQNSSDGMNLPLHSGQYLTAQWLGGLPGARYTLSVFGQRTG
jgi:hypothetical protein